MSEASGAQPLSVPQALRVAVYEAYNNPVPTCVDLTWADVVELLSTFEPAKCAAPGTAESTLEACAGRNCPSKYGQGWSPVDIDGPRRDVNVRTLSCAVFDLDHLKPGDLAKIEAALIEERLAAIIHSTHSHALDDECYRLVMPLSRPCPADDWRKVHTVIAAALALPADALHDRSRFYFLPTARDGVPPFVKVLEGGPIDLDDALAAAGDVRAPTKDVVEPPKEVHDLGELRARLSAARRSKAAQASDRAKEQAALLGRVLDGEPLASQGERDTTILRVCGLLAYWLPAHTPWEVALELLRPALSKMDVDPEGFEHWVEETRKKYERQMASRLEADAKRAADDAAIKELIRASKDKAAPEPEQVEADGGDWHDLLKIGREGVKGTEHNAQILLTFAPELRGTIKFNAVTKHIEVHGGPLANVDEGSLDVAAAAWLQRHYEFCGGSQLVGRVLLYVARANTYDPIHEYLGELAWDGVQRLDTFLEEYLGAKADSDEVLQHVRRISRRWLVSLVARALEPGCQCDTVLILEGAQGIGKSRGLEAIVSPAYFLDTAVELGSKDAMQAIAGAWLVELAELASFRRAEVERVKQFTTARVDKFRPPYGRATEDSPRRCVFAGTTNEDHYLTDRTGNRRYWVVRVTGVNVSRIRADRDQLLAEAAVAYRAGERWWLNAEEEVIARAQADERVDTSTIEEAIARWWYEMPPSKRPKQVTMLEVADLALHMTIDRITHSVKIEIGHAMTSLGFARAQPRTSGQRVRYYTPSEKMLTEPVRPTARAGHLALVRPKEETPERR